MRFRDVPFVTMSVPCLTYNMPQGHSSCQKERPHIIIIRENYRPERDDYKIDLQLDDMELELFIIKNCPKRPSYPEAYGLRHLAFAVDSVDNTVRELNKRGIITEPIRLDIYTGKRMTFFYDPDNLPLEIHE